MSVPITIPQNLVKILEEKLDKTEKESLFEYIGRLENRITTLGGKLAAATDDEDDIDDATAEEVNQQQQEE